LKIVASTIGLNGSLFVSKDTA